MDHVRSVELVTLLIINNHVPMQKMNEPARQILGPYGERKADYKVDSTTLVGLLIVGSFSIDSIHVLAQGKNIQE